MHADKRLFAEPKPDVLVYALADNSVNLGIRCHVGNDDYFQAKCELTERIKQAFDQAGISIPYPQRDVHMYHHVVGQGDGEQYRLVATQPATTSTPTDRSSAP